MSLAPCLAFASMVTLSALAAMIDLHRMIIPNQLNIGLALSGVAFATVLPSLCVIDAVSGLVAGGMLTWALRQAHFHFRGTEGLGLGDVKFVAAGGAWSGIMGLPAFLFLAAASALSYVAIRGAMFRPIGVNERIPFAPFLAGGLVTITSLQLFASGPPSDCCFCLEVLSRPLIGNGPASNVQLRGALPF